MGLRLMSVIGAWLVVVLLNVEVVSAANCAPAPSAFTIKTAQDVSDIVSCGTFTGNLVVAADGPEEIALDGIATISGNIDIENVSRLRSLSSTTLQSVQSFTLNSLPQLSAINFPALTNFSSLKWYNLPMVTEATVATNAPGGEIQEVTVFNTSFENLDWIQWPVGAQLNITYNDALETFTIPYNRINAGSALTLSNNAKLRDIDLSRLNGIYGGLQLSNNEKLTEVNFDRLETIGGFVQLNGEFTNVSMPFLTNINGALTVRSTTDISGLCDDLQQKNLQGHYDCTSHAEKGSSVNPTAIPTSTADTPHATPSQANPENNTSSFSKGAKIGVGISAVVVAVLFLIGAFFYIRYRIRSKVQEIEHKPKDTDSISAGSSSVNDSKASFAKELEVSSQRVELPNEREKAEMECGVPQELDAWHGSSELHTPVTPVSVAGSWQSVGTNSEKPLIRHELP